VTSDSLARSRHRKGARCHAFKMLQTKNPLATSIGPSPRPQNLADETWLQARGWMKNRGLWDNIDPLFQCRHCDSAGRLCRFKGSDFMAPNGGGLSLGSCTWCTGKHIRCSVTGRPLVKRYFWVQAKNGGGWKSDVKDVARQRDQHDVHIPRRSRNVSLEVIDDGPPGGDLDSSAGVLVRGLIQANLSAAGRRADPLE
jgi:hypothetical protein